MTETTGTGPPDDRTDQSSESESPPDQQRMLLDIYLAEHEQMLGGIAGRRTCTYIFAVAAVYLWVEVALGVVGLVPITWIALAALAAGAGFTVAVHKGRQMRVVDDYERLHYALEHGGWDRYFWDAVRSGRKISLEGLHAADKYATNAVGCFAASSAVTLLGLTIQRGG